MAFTLDVSPNPSLPGAVNIVVFGDDPADWNVESALSRIDGSYPAQPVRNYNNSSADGLETVTDCEAPLGRPVHYNLTNVWGDILAQSAQVICAPLPDNRAILRSVLAPNTMWMPVEPQDERNVTWETSTAVHRVVGRDTPVVIGEIRQRHSGTMNFLCRSINETDNLIRLAGDGTALLLRHDPCAQEQTRDMVFYALDVTEVRFGRDGWRVVSVDYQTSEFVHGDTVEPEWAVGWNFQALSESAPDFSTLTSLWRNFAFMSVVPMPPWTPRTKAPPTRALVRDAL